MSDKDEALRLELESTDVFEKLKRYADINFRHGGSGRREAVVNLEGIESDPEKLKERVEQLAMDWTAQLDTPHDVTVQYFDTRAHMHSENINYGVYALYLWVLPVPD